MTIQLEAVVAAQVCRHDGRTEARRAEFLECLSTTPDVRRACATVGLSRQSAYRLRARNPEFAAAWDDALTKGHAAARRAFIDALPEALRRILSDSSTRCHLRL